MFYRKAMQHSDVVINLTGREWETSNFKFEDINIHGPKMLARLARECGVKTFIHISALNAREKPQVRLIINANHQNIRPYCFSRFAIFLYFNDLFYSAYLCLKDQTFCEQNGWVKKQC